MFSRIKTISVVALLCFAFSYAHGIEKQDTLQMNSAEEYITFRVGDIAIDENFDGNGQRLSRIINHLHTTFADSSFVVASVEFSGMASPEGRSDSHYVLSGQPISNATEVLVVPIVQEKEEVVVIIADTIPEVKDWTRHLYLKTNTIGLGLLIANASVELDLSKH